MYKLHKRYKERGTVEDEPKTGAPVVYDEKEKRIIARAAVSRTDMSINDIIKDDDLNPKGASEGTIRNLLAAANIISRVLPSLYTGLSKRHLAQRVNFAKRHKNWTQIEWELLMFSDEADILPNKSGKRYYRTKGRQSYPDPRRYIREIKQNITIKVWGVISCFGVGPLIRYTGTMEEDKYMDILETYVVQEYPQLQGASWVETDLPPFIFVDDNAGAHRSNNVKKWKEENGFVPFQWPAHSPDLNIIENIWSYIEEELYQIGARLRSPDDTWRETQRIWNSIRVEYITKLYQSLPGRLERVLQKRGGPID